MSAIIALAMAFFTPGLGAYVTSSAAQANDAPRAQPASRPPELLGMARVNHRIAHMSFTISSAQAHVSEISVRSGSLAMTLQGIEIVFADGGQQRIAIDDSLAPGQASHPIPIDPGRALHKVSVAKQPGLHPGETVIQLLGRVVPAPGGRPALRSRP